MEDRADILRAMNVCRFCLSNDETKLTNIYKKVPEGKQAIAVPLPLQIMACVSIEVFENDGMPQLICHLCRRLTMQAYMFKTNCKKADDALKLFLATGQLAKPFMQQIEESILSPSNLKAQRNNSKRITPAGTSKSLQTDFFSSSENVTNMRENWTMMDDDTQDIKQILTEQHENEIEHVNLDDEEEDENEEFDEGMDISKLSESLTSSRQKSNVTQVPTDCFPCPHCERSFPLKQLLDLHVEIHLRERAFECDTCNRKFFTKYDLQKHMTTHEDVKPFSCVVCHKMFSRETLLRRHEKIHENVPRYVCTLCERTFLTKDYLDQHMERHRKKKPFVCKICNKSFVFKQGLERHELVHSENKPHKCNYCEASFTSAIKLTRHITSHAGLRPYPCKLCGRTFLLSHHLTRHMRSHYAIQSSNSSNLVVNQYKCDLCSMSFRRKDSLINHSVIHSMVNLKCVICNTSFENASLVKEHITTHLTGLPFPCDKCDYSFETSEQLEEHGLKHAEMEYEDQIEREVISEAMQQKEDEEEEAAGLDVTDDDNILSMCLEGLGEDGAIEEFTITDIENTEIAPKPKHSKDVETVTEKAKPSEPLSYFLKDELSSDLEDEEASQGDPKSDTREHEDFEPDIETIKPIVRQEGTKVYQRKKPANVVSRPKVEAVKPVQPSTSAQPSLQIDTIEELQSQVAHLPTNNPTKMMIGEKVVQVRKFIVTKEEMKAMAKEGLIEVKGNQVVLKHPNTPILNATLKPIQQTDIDSLLDRNKESRQIKQYQKRIGTDKSINFTKSV